MKNLIALIIPTILIICTACGPSSIEEFRAEGRQATRELIHDLQQVHNYAHLKESSQKIMSDFNELVDIMIRAQEYQFKHPELEIPELSAIDRQLSDQLRLEMIRVCQIDGGKQIMEKCQEPSLNHLDLFHKQIERKKNAFILK